MPGFRVGWSGHLETAYCAYRMKGVPMQPKKDDRHRSGAVDYSAVTPATGTEIEDKPIADTFANQMPTADIPAVDASSRANPDKTIPGPEAASGLDAAA